MAISNPKDVFLYEMAVMHGTETKIGSWLGEISGQIRDGNLQQVVRTEQQECQQKIKNIESCSQAVGGRPKDVPSQIGDGLRSQFQDFMNRQPAPEAMEMYTMAVMLQASHFGIATYRALVDKAMTMGQAQCAQMLRSNLVAAEECAGKLDRVAHEMNQRVMATA